VRVSDTITELRRESNESVISRARHVPSPEGLVPDRRWPMQPMMKFTRLISLLLLVAALLVVVVVAAGTAIAAKPG
jgi:hypothetical protein